MLSLSVTSFHVIISNHSTSEAKFHEILCTCFKFYYCEMSHCEDSAVSLLMKRDSWMVQRPRNAFVFIREVGSYCNLNAGRRRDVSFRRGVGSYSRDCLLISVPDFPRALLLSYESPREVSTAKSIQLYKCQVFISATTRTKGHHMGWVAGHCAVFCPRIWEVPYSNLGRNIYYSDSFVVS